MKTALVTGSAGFVGRHVAAKLAARGWSVTGVDERNGAVQRVMTQSKNALQVFQADSTRYDVVVHCAAREPYRAAIDNQPGNFAYNMMLDSMMFEWAVRTGQGRVVYLSSSAAYPTSLQGSVATGVPLQEDTIDLSAVTAGRPDASYGWTKLTGEQLAAAARQAGLPVTVVRPFSGYGTDQDVNFPFGAFLDRVVRRDDPFVVWGDGTQVRDWIHVDDIVNALVAIAQSGTTDPVNLCTGIGTSMTDLVALMTAIAGYRPQIQYLTGQPNGVAYRVGDPTRLHTYYTPGVTLQQGISRALAEAGV